LEYLRILPCPRRAYPADQRSQGKKDAKTYHGSCHCGAVRFEADLDLTQPTIAQLLDLQAQPVLAAVVKPAQFRVIAGRDELKAVPVQFHAERALLRKTCGVRPFGRASPEG
jgi:hypothetical protein